MTPSTLGSFCCSTGAASFAGEADGVAGLVSSVKVTFLGLSTAFPLPLSAADGLLDGEVNLGKGEGNWKKNNRS
jgi:hypothetical protein